MTREELETEIGRLKQGAEGLDEPDKTFKLNDIAQLEIELQGMALADVTAALRDITLPDLNEMKAQIDAAVDATSAHERRVNAFNTAYGLLTKGLRLAVGGGGQSWP